MILMGAVSSIAFELRGAFLKAVGVILVHLEVDKMTQEVIFTPGGLVQKFIG
jgi:hypothetical protein